MRILIIDAPSSSLTGMVFSLSKNSEVEKVGIAPDTSAAIALYKEMRPEYVVLGMALSVGSRLDFLNGIKKWHPVSFIAVVVNDHSWNNREMYVKAGADFFIDSVSEIESLFSPLVN